MENALNQKKLEEKAKVETKQIFKGKVFTLQRDRLYFDDHPPHDWDLIVHPGAVAIIPIANNGNIVLIKQWRRAINKIIYELPAGTLDSGETPLECAKREIQEEIGYKANTIIPFGGLYSAPGFSTEYIHLYIAKDLIKSSLPQDTHEGIDVCHLPLSKILQLIDTNEIDDAKTISGIMRYKRSLDA